MPVILETHKLILMAHHGYLKWHLFYGITVCFRPDILLVTKNILQASWGSQLLEQCNADGCGIKADCLMGKIEVTLNGAAVSTELFKIKGDVKNPLRT